MLYITQVFNKKLLRAFSIAFLLCISPVLLFAQKESDFCTKSSKLSYIINKLHYNPPKADSAFLKQVVEAFLFSIDGQGIILYQKDINEIDKIRASEKNTEQAYCKIYEYTNSIYKRRLLETDSLILGTKTNEQKWINAQHLNINEQFTRNYPIATKDKIERVNTWYKWYFLRQLDIKEKLLTGNEWDKNSDLRAVASNNLRKNVKRRLDNPNGVSAYLEENLLEAIAQSCDPHSNYFTPVSKKQFNESLSTMVEKFGISFFDNESDVIEIGSIAPGSSAWKSNKLNIGDIIQKVQFPNKPVIDASTMSSYELSNALDLSNDKEIVLTVVKKSNEIEEVKITKELIPSEENMITGYIIGDSIPMGYLSLPSFYTDFKQGNVSGCANDVAKELIKLKQENIQGLIIDLRNNGGGSIDEAINLAGIFVDQGPLFFEQTKNAKAKLIKDANRGLIYAGPIVILINKNSASASELFAQILRSYHRAIIVGDRSFGKASAQVIFPLDTTVSLFGNRTVFNTDDGFVKLSIGRLYDVSGKTYQKDGLEPDIKIPDVWTKAIETEDYFKNAFPNDQISRNINLSVWPDTKIEYCAEKSKERIGASAQFKHIQKLMDTVSWTYNSYKIPITPKAYADYRTNYKNLQTNIDKLNTLSEGLLTIKPSKYTLEIMKVDPFLTMSTELSIEDIKSDLYIKESYNILNDYISK